MLDISKEALTEFLREEVITVTFEKKDGTERTMHCTLKEDLLPVRPALKEGEEPKVKKANPMVLPVYDVDAKAFRSFRMDSLKKVTRK